MQNGLCQEGLHPVYILTTALSRRFLIVATGHRQQVANRHSLQIIAHLSRKLVRKETDDLVGQRHLSIGNGQSDSRSGKGLAHRVKYMRHAVSPLALPATIDNLTILDDHHTMNVHRVVDGFLEEIVHSHRHAVGRLSPGQVNHFSHFANMALAGRQYHQHHGRKQTGFVTHSSVV